MILSQKTTFFTRLWWWLWHQNCSYSLIKYLQISGNKPLTGLHARTYYKQLIQSLPKRILNNIISLPHTCFKPLWVKAEHSRYFVARIFELSFNPWSRLMTDKPCFDNLLITSLSSRRSIFVPKQKESGRCRLVMIHFKLITDAGSILKKTHFLTNQTKYIAPPKNIASKI